MKKITFILTSMLFLLVGGVFSQEVTTLYLNGGANWDATDGSNEWHDYNSGITYTSGNVKLKGQGWNPGSCGLTGTNWIATVNADEIHTFTVTLREAPGNNHFVLAGGDPTYGEFNRADENGHYKVIQRIAADATSASIELTKTYNKVYILNTEASNEILKIASITRTITTASSVAAPTISPASSTYDGDLSVTITKGDGNDRVVYSISGATTGNATDAEFTENSKTLNLTGTGTITVTAIGYESGDASSEVTNTYTYSIPSGQSSTTSGLPYTFNSWDGGNSITFNNSFFSNIETGDYVVFDVANVAQNGTVLGFRDSWDESPYRECTTTSGGNGAKGTLNIGDTQWWMKVNSDVVNSLKNHEVRMQGGMVPKETAGTESDVTSSVDLTSIKVYKSKGVSESLDNSLTKINHVVVELTRSFVANMWNTVCLPFALTSAQATQLFGSGYQLAEFTDVSGTTMKFTTAASFDAGVPYLVKPTIDVSNASPVVLFDVDITAKTPQTVTHGGYSFVGNFTQKTFSGGECNTSRFVATGNELMTPNEDTTLKSLRCYFTVPVAAARSLSFDVDEEGNTTGVADINRETITNNGDFFNLAGQRVAQPTKGLYIVNGKKVVIK